MNKMKRLAAILIALVLIVGMLPVSAFAEGEPPATGTDIAVERITSDEETTTEEIGSPSDSSELPGTGEDEEQGDNKGLEEKTAGSTPAPELGKTPEKKAAPTRKGGDPVLSGHGGGSNPAPGPTACTVEVTCDAAHGSVTGGGTYAEDESVTVTATPNEGYAFSHWTGAGKTPVYEASYTFSIADNVSLTAHFAKAVELTVAADPAGGGTVTGSGTYAAGSSATATAKTNDGYVFTGWYEGDTLKSYDTSCEVGINNENKTVTARFLSVQENVIDEDDNEPGYFTVKQSQQPPTITLTAADAWKPYDGKPLTENGFIADGLPDGFTVEVTMSGASTITNAGMQLNMIESYVIKNSAGEVKTDEFNVQTIHGTLTVEPKHVTITVHSSVKPFGASDPVFTGTVMGLVDPGDLGTVRYVRTGSGTDEAVNSYPGVLDATYTANRNYNVTVVKGDFRITPTPAPAPPDSNVTVEVTSDCDGATYVKKSTGELNKRTFVGDIVCYSITVCSTGKDPAEDIIINVSIPNGLALISGDLQQSIQSLEPGDSYTTAINLRIDEMPDDISFDVTATAQCYGMQEPASSTNKLKVKYSVITSAEPEEGGSITAPLLGVEGRQTITYAPNQGYRLKSLTLDEQTLSVSDYPDSYTFADITKDHFFTAEFAEAYELADVSVQQTGTLTYSGKPQTANVTTSATAVNNETVTFAYSAEQNGTYSAEVPAFTDAGTHTVYYKASAADHNDATGSFAVTLGKAPLTLGLSIEGWTESEAARTPVLTGNTGNGAVTFEYKPAAADEAAYSTSVPTAPGEYNIRATVEETSNYLGGEITADFVIDAIPPAPDPVAYSCIKGSGGEWTKGNKKTLGFTFKRSVDDAATYKRFTGIKLDGRSVPEKDSSGNANYEAKSGSVIIDLQPSFLETLSVGKHTLTAEFEDGSTTADFTVKKAQDNNGGNTNNNSGNNASQTTNRGSGTTNKTPAKAATTSGKAATTASKTGDENNALLWIWLMAVSFAGVQLIRRKRLYQK